MSSLLEKAKKLPDSPGVYMFLGKKRRVLYVGKATSIRDRVRSYFNKDIVESRGPLIQKMLSEAKTVDCIKTDSVLEALILEANLIKKYQPIYNTKEKSDKSFNYVIITDEDFPRILLVREKEILQNKISNHKSDILNLKSAFGPFPQGSTLKEALKIIRKIFLFRDTCIPPHKKYTDKLEYIGMSFKKGLGKPCFNRQIGLCPGVCTGEISKKEYQNTIRNIKFLFEGKKKTIIKKLTSEMNAAAKKREFEKAGEIKKTLFALKHIQDISLIKPTTYPGLAKRSGAGNLQPTTFKIEAYDVAHMAGKHIVGVMVVIEDGVVKKSDYRKFNIKTVETGNDVGALKEIIERRLGHAEWPLPRLFVVDGGKAQVNAVEHIFKKYEIQIPVVGVVKNEHHRPKNILGNRRIIENNEKEILLANSEAHRFAVAFHRKNLRKKLK
ncbi:MAG: UvrB/UvrC motif-containing protein [Parcubacteria group bacterium]|nr:UvrB/UvrC motif-containing protein [Parcubacteria group bacterium]